MESNQERDCPECYSGSGAFWAFRLRFYRRSGVIFFAAICKS
jgi:hypothetical protein